MFCCAAFVLGRVGQEFWRGARARRAMTGESVPRRAARAGAPQPPPLRRLHRARRDRRPVRRRGRVVGLPAARDVRLAPGQTATVGGYDVTYVQPRRREHRPREDDARRRAERLAATASRSRTLRPTRGYFPSQDADARAGRRALLRGRGDERGRPDAPACAATSGPPSSPTSQPLEAAIAAADKQLRRRPARDARRRSLDRGDRRSATAGAAARDVPHHRLAAGDLDLDRRR